MGIGEQYEFEKTGRIIDEGNVRATQEPTMSEIKCPNCGSSNTVYSIPDWEHDPERGNFCVDPGWFECKNCCYHTGFQNTEDEIHAVIESFSRTTQEPTVNEQIKKPCFDDCIGMDDFPRVDECLQGTESAQMCSHLSARKDWRSCDCGGKSDLLSQYLGWQKQKQALDLHEMTTKIFEEQADTPTKPATNTASNPTPWTAEAPSKPGRYKIQTEVSIDKEGVPFLFLNNCQYYRCQMQEWNCLWQGPLKPGGEV